MKTYNVNLTLSGVVIAVIPAAGGNVVTETRWSCSATLFEYCTAFCFVILLSGYAHAQSCEDYFQTALQRSSELKHAAEFRVRMGTVSRGKLSGEQLFGAGRIARGEKGVTFEATANFHWVNQQGGAGQETPAFHAVRREQVKLTFAREGRRVLIRITGDRQPILLEPRCADGLVYAENPVAGGIDTWVFHLPFPGNRVFTSGADLTQYAVLTQHNDNSRTGAYMQETQLTPQSVKSLVPRRFGLLQSFDVDGQVYAQPLYVPDVRIADGTYHNLLYVATSTNHVYAFDVDDPFVRSAMLHIQLGVPALPDDLGVHNNVIYPNVGITSTPVIDMSTNTIYLVAKNVSYLTVRGRKLRTLQDEIFALDITSLAVKDSAVVRGPGRDTSGFFDFDPGFSATHKNRPGLLLLKNRIYIGFGAFNREDLPTGVHGWIFSFDAKNLGSPPAVFNASPDSAYAGIWQSGNGLASDGTYIYVNTGNGGLIGTGTSFQSGNKGDSVLKLNADLQLLQSYTPPNVKCLDTCDLDLGSSGPVLFPGSNTLLSGGKEGIFYVFSSIDISHTVQCPFRAADTPGFHGQIPTCSKDWGQNGCEVADTKAQCGADWGKVVAEYSHIHGAPVVLQTGPGQYQVYVWPEENPLKMFTYSSGMLSQSSTTAQGADAQAPLNSMPGGVMSLSANPQGKNAILWGTVPKECSQPGACYCAPTDPLCDTETASLPGRFVAFDANTLEELWSDLNVGYFAKFTPPTIADGKVFVANFGPLDPPGKPICGFVYNNPTATSCGQVRVYGLWQWASEARELMHWPYSWIDPGPLGPRVIRRGE